MSRKRISSSTDETRPTSEARAAASSVEPAAVHAAGVSRRDAIKGMLAMAGMAVLFANPVLARATPSATQETLDALDDAQAAYDEVEAKLNEISAQYQALSREQDQTLTEIEGVQAQIEDTQAQIEAGQAKLEEQQQALSGRVSTNYKKGGNDALALLLASESFDELISNAYYVEKVNEKDRAIIAEVEETRKALEAQKVELEAQKAELEDLKAQQAARLDEMRAKQEETQELLSGLDEDVRELIAQRDAEILAAAQAEAEAERKRKEEEERRRREEEERQQGSSQGGGTSTPPVLPELGSGQEYSAASAAQKRVVNSCYYTPSPGTGYCAMWVSRVMSNAGFGYPTGDANDMYNAWCTSSNKANLQVGMIIAVSTHSHTFAGRIYGHIGIYIGDNKVMHNIGPIKTDNLDTWISYYGTTVTPRWGWASGIDLSARS